MFKNVYILVFEHVWETHGLSMELLVLGAVAFVASLLLLYIGAKKTLQGAVLVANGLGMSKVITGTVIVASITALPELMSSLTGQSGHHPI